MSFVITCSFQVVALRVGPVVAHHQRHLLGGQRATHLQIGRHLEVVQLAQQVERGDPVLGVRTTCQRDGAGGRSGLRSCS